VRFTKKRRRVRRKKEISNASLHLRRIFNLSTGEGRKICARSWRRSEEKEEKRKEKKDAGLLHRRSERGGEKYSTITLWGKKGKEGEEPAETSRGEKKRKTAALHLFTWITRGHPPSLLPRSTRAKERGEEEP